MTGPKIISLFTGAGGLDYGFEAAGFDTAVAVELDATCCKTLRTNRSWPVLERDILTTPTTKILAEGELEVGAVEAVIGGPPCTPWSKAGYWARGDSRRLEDPIAKTLGAYMRVIEEVRPRVFVLENVEGLAFADKDEGLRLVLKRIEQVNRRAGCLYKPVYRVVNAANFGVPQMRERFILVAARDGTEFKFPAETHAEEPAKGSALEPWRTAWDALADVKRAPEEHLAVKGKWASLLPSIPEGQNYLFHTPEGDGLPLFGWRTRYWSFLLKLAKNRPSWTIPAQPGPSIGPFHWENRRLSMRELCRLQTFPDDIQIEGGRTAVQRQLGNAVPSLLAEVLAREIRVQLLGLPALAGPAKLLPAKQAEVPRRFPVRAVPAEFEKYKGAHKPHPGVGRGPGATAQLKAAV